VKIRLNISFAKKQGHNTGYRLVTVRLRRWLSAAPPSSFNGGVVWRGLNWLHQVSTKFASDWEKRDSRSLKTLNAKEAESAKAILEENLRLIGRGRMEFPNVADTVWFLLSNGKVSGSIKVNTLAVKELFNNYFDALPHGSLEKSTIYTMGIHRKSLERHFGERPVDPIDHLALQEYIKARDVLPITARKELATLKTVWHFGIASGLIEVTFPPTKLKFPKGQQRPPFEGFKNSSELPKVNLRNYGNVAV
jgi:hypothetical protein